MALRKILAGEDASLRKVCRPVTDFNTRLWQLLDDMHETLLYTDGIGIAAPQVGILRRVAVIDMRNDDGVIELINPEIIEQSGSHRMCESCLSVPEVWGYVNRPQVVKVRALDRHGNEQFYTGENELAAVFMHETDHLGGVLFTDLVTEYIDNPEQLEIIRNKAVQQRGRNKRKD